MLLCYGVTDPFTDTVALYVAVMENGVIEVTCPVTNVNVAEVAPAATVTEGGRVIAVVEDFSVTTAPPEGAAALSFKLLENIAVPALRDVAARVMA